MLARASWLHRPPPSFCGSAWPLSIEATHRHHSPHSTWRGNTTLHSSCRSNTCVGILDYDHVKKTLIKHKIKNYSFSLTSSCILASLQLVLKVPFILINKLLHSRQFTACSQSTINSLNLAKLCFCYLLLEIDTQQTYNHRMMILISDY